ncbi:macrophage mannose receptor 1-like, partial [Stylophora pistillata]|uniref:macrophage mannose receptor 1-like n=1 Tax=Stylophora pistillata TaxID=50429 RepID=UPI000C04FF0C
MTRVARASTESPCTHFKKSSYIFTKWGRRYWENSDVCFSHGGDLVSIETDEEWNFIKGEIQKRNSWNTTAWHIGLCKGYSDGNWTWSSGARLNISKWRNSEPNGSDYRAEISKNGGLFKGISSHDENAFICEFPEECPSVSFENSWYTFTACDRCWRKRRHPYSLWYCSWGWDWGWNRAACQSLGGDLVSIETEEEWNFITDEIQRRNASIPKNGWSIGLMKKAGNWTWMCGTPLTISKWGDGQPSGDGNGTHIYKASSNGTRIVIGDCSEDLYSDYICEIPRDIDECSQNIHNCSNITATCSNTVGAFRCICKPGFNGDGHNCT